MDDRSDMVLSLTMLLESVGHKARGIYWGDEVVEAVRSFSPDLVLCDIGLPDMTGYEVARAVRKNFGPAAPYMAALTAYGLPRDRELALAAGFDEHLTKPCAPQDLLSLLDRVAGDKGR